MRLVTLEGNHGGMCGCGCSPALNGVYVPGVGGELGKFSFRIGGKRGGGFLRRLKPKGGLKLKLKLKGPNIGKATRNFFRPFEKIGGSFANMATGIVDSAGGAAAQILQEVGAQAPGLVSAAAKIAPNLLAPGAGGMLSSLIPGLSDMLPGMSDMLSPQQQQEQSAQDDPRERAMQMLQQQADGVFRPASSSLMQNLSQSSDDAAMIAQQQSELAKSDDNKMLIYGGLALAGLLVITQMGGKKS